MFFGGVFCCCCCFFFFFWTMRSATQTFLFIFLPNLKISCRGVSFPTSTAEDFIFKKINLIFSQKHKQRSNHEIGKYHCSLSDDLLGMRRGSLHSYASQRFLRHRAAKRIGRFDKDRKHLARVLSTL